MKSFSFVLIVLCPILTVTVSEQFGKSISINKNSDLTAVALEDHFDFDVLQLSDATMRPAKQHFKSQKFEVFDFLKAIKNVVKQKPNHAKYFENETDKRLESPQPNLQSTFGNKEDFQLIYLGTKWCGAGDIAKNKRDIGYFYLTDSCCRAHDLCPKIIPKNSSNYGLKNTGKFTRSHCDCDDEFYQCLKSVNTIVSKQIGLVYFNILGPQCFKEDHPMQCVKQFRNRCVSYKIDSFQPKVNQWKDNKWF